MLIALVIMVLACIFAGFVCFGWAVCLILLVSWYCGCVVFCCFWLWVLGVVLPCGCVLCGL